MCARTAALGRRHRDVGSQELRARSSPGAWRSGRPQVPRSPAPGDGGTPPGIGGGLGSRAGVGRCRLQRSAGASCNLLSQGSRGREAGTEGLLGWPCWLTPAENTRRRTLTISGQWPGRLPHHLAFSLLPLHQRPPARRRRRRLIGRPHSSPPPMSAGGLEIGLDRSEVVRAQRTLHYGVEGPSPQLPSPPLCKGPRSVAGLRPLGLNSAPHRDRPCLPNAARRPVRSCPAARDAQSPPPPPPTRPRAGALSRHAGQILPGPGPGRCAPWRRGQNCPVRPQSDRRGHAARDTTPGFSWSRSEPAMRHLLGEEPPWSCPVLSVIRRPPRRRTSCCRPARNPICLSACLRCPAFSFATASGPLCHRRRLAPSPPQSNIKCRHPGPCECPQSSLPFSTLPSPPSPLPSPPLCTPPQSGDTASATERPAQLAFFFWLPAPVAHGASRPLASHRQKPAQPPDQVAVGKPVWLSSPLKPADHLALV